MQFLIRAFARLSLRNSHALGLVLGWLGYALSGSYRRRLNEQARWAGLTPGQRREAVGSAGRMVAELPWLWLRPADQPLARLAQWQGAELIDEALAARRGLLLLTPHLGCFEVAAQAYVERFGSRTQLMVMYRPARQAWLRDVIEASRHRPGLATVSASLSGVRQMIRALRRGESVGLLPDQVPPEGMGVWAPFLGRPAYTMTLAHRLVQQTGALMLFIWAERLPRGQGYLMRVSPLTEPMPSQALDDTDGSAWQAACAASINREMERLIRQCPGQYLWGYHRFKQPRPQAAVTVEAGR
jgi:Kdo2-lipid IVA lauroyltransferase/acyltransferase